MDAIIGRYKARIEETGLILGHATGITFDLNLEETIRLMDFLNVYRETLLSMQEDAEPHTEPRLARIVINKTMRETEEL